MAQAQRGPGDWHNGQADQQQVQGQAPGGRVQIAALDVFREEPLPEESAVSLGVVEQAKTKNKIKIDNKNLFNIMKLP